MASRLRLRPALRHNALGLLRRGGGAAFDPLSLGDKLIAWWDFSDTNTLYIDAGTTPVVNDGDAIYQVTDKSGNGHLLRNSAGTSSVRPIYRVNALAGHSAAEVAFDYLLADAPVFASTSGLAVVTLAQSANVTSSILLIAGRVQIRERSNIGKKAMYFLVDAAYAYSSVDSDGALSIYVMRHHDGWTGLHNNGGPVIAASSTLTFDATSFIQVGGQPEGYLYETFVLENCSLDDINNLGAYLSAKWGATWTDIPLSEGAGALHIQFDDGPAGIYDNAFPYMTAAGITGTVYITTNWIGSPGYMTAEQLQTLDNAGWDIGNHGATHTHLDTLTLAQQETELSSAKNALDALGLTRASAHLAYPGGHYNADTLTACANTGMVTGRQAVKNTGVIVPTADVYEIPAVAYTLATNLDVLKTTISNSVSAGQHILVYMHDVQETPNHSYDVTTAQMQALIDWVVANNITCKTITELPLA